MSGDAFKKKKKKDISPIIREIQDDEFTVISSGPRVLAGALPRASANPDSLRLIGPRILPWFAQQAETMWTLVSFSQLIYLQGSCPETNSDVLSVSH